MIRSLDPHSAYLTPDQYKELQVDTSGSFGGLGIVISMQNDQLTVVSPIEDTPAFKAGIKAGDRIMKIDGQITKGMSIQDAVKKMRGPENTKVTLTILRKDMKEPRDYEITRAVIKIKSVSTRLQDSIATSHLASRNPRRRVQEGLTGQRDGKGPQGHRHRRPQQPRGLQARP